MPDTQNARATARIESDVQMLNSYLGGAELAPLIAAMEALARSPDDPALRARVESVFSGLGILQGAVLTYAPYLAEMLAGSLLDNAPEPAPVSGSES
ncbi:MAG: hypothetical protein ACK4R8_10435 [Thiobacillus sp.]